MIRGTIAIAATLGVVFIGGCSGDDAESGLDGGFGRDAGPMTDGGRAGTTGGGRAGSGGSTTAGTGAAADDDAGIGEDEDGGSTTAGTGAGGAGGNGGTAGASAGAGGTAGTGAEPGPGCAGLAACCAQLPDPDRMSCDLVATNADDAMCEQFQPLFCEPPTGSEDSCPMLNACCETLQRGPLRLACATTVMDGMPLQCEQSLLAFCPEGGDPNACASLSACCATLRPPQRPACLTIVEQGLAASCESVEALLCPQR